MIENAINKFNIRVYGLIANDNNQILLSDEFQAGMKMTKFPGGGLNFGEGAIDCIKREAMEEFGQAIKVIKHFYTTDFFQQSYFISDTQLISIYYFVKFIDEIRFKVALKPFDFHEMKNGNQSFRWVKINDLTTDLVTLPVDKVVVQLLINFYFLT